MKKIVFMGTPDFSVPVLQALANSDYEVVLAVTQPDRPKGRKKVLTPPPVKTAAEELGIAVFQPERLKEDWEPIREVEPDLIVTAAYGQLLPKELLDLPDYGCVNVHASLLPELRGGAPIHYAILQGKKETGITIMYMAEKLDAGDIISQQSLVIERNDDVGTLHEKLSEIGAKLLLNTLPKLFEGNVEAIPQDESKATFASNIKRSEEKIDWTRTAEEIFNQVRGLRPWPVAFTACEGQNIKIWAVEPIQTSNSGKPGEITSVENGTVTVACGDNQAVNLIEIQPAGKKRMNTDDYLKGSKIILQPGTILGESK
ncbi:methionyl-tRNA formyltransferase [Aciduricibacillus chroicocephali]|uniref:Methionyl-tRNA formyltransferase n=1 Tax=Aciduricibacillus chroicocephali TaxID=3054939 RepID=A0ABY9KYK5_9BACI|nr:methionyl-tRNA formyltransferase [Bacillaceae bacterium 44XB]